MSSTPLSLALTGACLLLISCGDKGDDTSAPEDSWSPEDLASSLPAPGSFGVGYQVHDLSYPDPVAGLEGEGDEVDRELRVAIWYPSSEETLGEEIRYQGVFVGSDVVDGAAWSEAPAAGFPVVISSHGHQGYAESSAFLFAHLASHGFVVISPEHTDNTTFDGGDRTTGIYIQRQHDMSEALDAALGGELSGVGSLDPDAIGGVGYSFGGYTSFALAGLGIEPEIVEGCETGTDSSAFCSTMTDEHASQLLAGFGDARIGSWLVLATGDRRLFDTGGIDDLSAPMFLLSAERDSYHTEDTESFFASLDPSGDHHHLHFTGAGHGVFADFGYLVDEDSEASDNDAVWPALQAVSLAWMRRQLLQDGSVYPVFTGEITWGDAMEWRER